MCFSCFQDISVFGDRPASVTSDSVLLGVVECVFERVKEWCNTALSSNGLRVEVCGGSSPPSRTIFSLLWLEH